MAISLDFNTNIINYLILNEFQNPIHKTDSFCYYYQPNINTGYFRVGSVFENGFTGAIKDMNFYKNNIPNLNEHLVKNSFEKYFSTICHKNCEKCIGEDFNQCVFCKSGFFLKENKKDFVVGSCENKYIPNFIKSPKLYYTQSHSFILLTQNKRYFLKSDKVKEQTFNHKLLVSIIYPLDFKLDLIRI